MEKMITKINVFDGKENPIFGEGVTSVIIEDDAAGPYLILEQHREDEDHYCIKLDFKEIDFLFEIIKEMVNDAKKKYPAEKQL